jgi:hypothetical protein
MCGPERLVPGRWRVTGAPRPWAERAVGQTGFIASSGSLETRLMKRAANSIGSPQGLSREAKPAMRKTPDKGATVARTEAANDNQLLQADRR